MAVVGVELVATGAQQFQKFSDLLEILFANHRRLGDEAEGTFQIGEANGAVEFEIEFGAVEQMKNCQIMFLKTKVLKATEQFRCVAKEI